MADLKLNNVSKYINESMKVENFSLSVSRGEIVTVQCPPTNGLLLVQLISNEIVPTYGHIIISDKTKISHVFSSFGFDPRLTVKDIVSFYANISFSKINVTEVIEVFGLKEVENCRSGKLNSTERMLLGFAASYVQSPNLMVAHELTFEQHKDTILIIQRVLAYLKSKEVGVLIFTTLKEEAILLGDKSYYIGSNGVMKFETQLDCIDDNENDLNIKIEKIPVKLDNKIILFNPFEIDYVEAFNNNTCIYVNGASYSCNFSISEIEKRLVTFGFFRNHRSYLVNLQKIKEVVIWSKNAYSLVLNNSIKSSIPISKARLDKLKRLINF